MNRAAVVKIFNERCGVLYETSEGFIFEYDDEYMKRPDAVSISMKLPISNKKHFSNILFPFFDGLIPEGWILDLYASKWKLNTADRFDLLLKTTEDPIGAVSVEEIVL